MTSRYMQGHVLDNRANSVRDIGWGIACAVLIGPVTGSALFSLGVIPQNSAWVMQLSVLLAVLIIYGGSVLALWIPLRWRLAPSPRQDPKFLAHQAAGLSDNTLAFVQNVHRFCLANFANDVADIASSLRPPKTAYWSAAIAAALVYVIVTGAVLSGIMLFIIGMICELFFRRRAVREVQAQLDSAAAAFHDRFKASSSKPENQFGLYLRAFTTTGQLIIQGIDFESAIAYYLAPYMNILAVGRQGEHVGAGRIEMSNDDWQANVARLAAEANPILLVPSDRPGTLWEILMLKEKGYFSKTVFVMPPNLAFRQSSQRFVPYAQIWNDMRVTLMKQGVVLPEHTPQGLLFQLNDFGEVVSKCTLDPDHQIARVLSAIRSGDGANGEYLDGLEYQQGVEATDTSGDRGVEGEGGGP